MTLARGCVGLTNSAEDILVVDSDSGEVRERTEAGVGNIARAIDASGEMDVCERPVGVRHVPSELVPLHDAEIVFPNTSKHIFISPFGGRLLHRIAQMGQEDNLHASNARPRQRVGVSG